MAFAIYQHESVLYIVVFICQSHSPSASHPLPHLYLFQSFPFHTVCRLQEEVLIVGVTLCPDLH